MTDSTFTLATLLHDPLVQLMMRSDNVSEQDHMALLVKVKDTLEMRELMDGCRLGMMVH